MITNTNKTQINETEVKRTSQCGVCGGTEHNRYGQCIPCLRRRNRNYYYKMKELKALLQQEDKLV